MKTTLKRFKEIWQPNFLQKMSQEESQSVTWKFWFSFNAIAALVISIAALFGCNKALNQGLNYLQNNYPDAKLVVEGGRLSTQGLNEPILQEGENKSVFVLDTKNEKYDAAILDNYQSGIFVGAEKIYNKKDAVETQSYNISKIDKNFSLTQQELQAKIRNNFGKIYAFIFALFFTATFAFFAGLKLISALWWALIFWIVARIVNIKEMTFEKTYYGVLNFYCMVLLFQAIFLFAKISFPFSTTLIFLVLFGINFREMKKNSQPIVITEQESKMKLGELKKNLEENKK